MPKLATYKVLKDGTFSLDSGESKEISFSLPNDLASDANLILAYQARPLPNPPFQQVVTISTRLEFQADIDSLTIRGDTIHGLWEAFPRSAVNTDISNTVIFEAENGKVRISDVILWYKRVV